MDVPNTAAAFATIVGLIADFASQRQGKTDHDYAEFVAWLAETRHSELVGLLRQNAATSTCIKALLNQDRRILLEKIEHLDQVLASLASSVEGFAVLAATVRPGSELSQQALRILREFQASGAGKALDSTTFGGRSLMLFEGGDGEIHFDELRFIDDDLNMLLESGLLRLDFNPRGERLFLFTRYAAEYVQRLHQDG